eukprot:474686-Pelagomonas_calceolata.AAC.1
MALEVGSTNRPVRGCRQVAAAAAGADRLGGRGRTPKMLHSTSCNALNGEAAAKDDRVVGRWGYMITDAIAHSKHWRTRVQAEYTQAVHPPLHTHMMVTIILLNSYARRNS